MAPEAIAKALESGVMAHQGATLPAEDRQSIANWLGNVRAIGGATCQGVTSREPAGALTAANVKHLELKWAFGFPNATMVRSRPAIHKGRLFTGSQDGTVYALDAASGCVFWSASIGAAIRSNLVLGGTAAAPNLYFGDSAGRVSALATGTGRLLWQTQADQHPATRLTGAPVYWRGRLYVPVSSSEEASALQPGYLCCTFRGSVLALDAASGRVLWKSYTIAEPPVKQVKTKRGTATVGPSGAAVWSAPLIDPQRNALYVTTGDNYTDPVTTTSDAVLAFDLDSGRLLWSRQFTTADAMNLSCWQPGKLNCPDSDGPDFDFGAPPLLVDLGGHKRALILSQKSGMVYAVDPDAKGRPLWEQRVAKGGNGEQRPYVDAIQRALRKRGRTQTGERGKNVDGPCDAPRNSSFRNPPRETSDERLAYSAFVSAPFTPAQTARAALVPRPVVARKHYDRVLIQTIFLQARKHFSHAPVELFDDISVQAQRRFASKARRRRQRYVWIRMRHIQEEWAVLGLGNEPQRLLCVPRR